MAKTGLYLYGKVQRQTVRDSSFVCICTAVCASLISSHLSPTGQKANPSERKEAIKTAESFIKQMGYPANTQVYFQLVKVLLKYHAIYVFFLLVSTVLVWLVVFLMWVLQIQVLPEGGETPLFKQFFLDWKERDQSRGFGKVFITESIARIQQVEFDVSKLHESHHMAAQYNMVDDGSGNTQVKEHCKELSTLMLFIPKRATCSIHCGCSHSSRA